MITITASNDLEADPLTRRIPAIRRICCAVLPLIAVACASCSGGKVEAPLSDVEPPLSDCAKVAQAEAGSVGAASFTHVTNGSAPNEAVLHFRNVTTGKVWTVDYLCPDTDRTPERAVAEQETDRCIEHGLAYFQEIGSWPVLQMPPDKGRSAAEVAEERCRRTTTAFP